MKDKTHRTILKITLGVLVVMLLGISTFFVSGVVLNKNPSLEKNSEGAITAGAIVQTEANEIETVEDDDTDDEKEVQVSSAGALITETKAKEIAINKIGGVVTDVETESVNGRKAWEIEIKVNGKEADVLVDMNTGEVINVEWEDEQEEDD
jgi:uncharacterized membrane protein YkoI